MRTVSRFVFACAAAGAMLAAGGAHVARASVITDPTGNVQVATGGECAQRNFGVAVSTTGCANGTVAVSGTGQAFGGVAVSGTGQAITDSDLTPVAVSGTGGAGGCGDLGAYAVSGTGTTYGCHGANVSGGNAGYNPYDPAYPCDTNASVNVSLTGHACAAPVSVCGGCFIPVVHGATWYRAGTRRF
ncbi:MAG TPA: hypothetical protein VN193_08435 [Candidatus Angelobacter sp.]|jgi:hypothetical protein|nr:hypothetical protein [Candidatus Angelobacter sp.]